METTASTARQRAHDAREKYLRLRAAGIQTPPLLTLVCQHDRALLTVFRFEGHEFIDATFLGRVVADDSPHAGPEGVIVGPGEADPDKGKVDRYREYAHVLPVVGIFDAMTAYDVQTRSKCCAAHVPLPWLRDLLRDTPAKRRLVVTADHVVGFNRTTYKRSLGIPTPPTWGTGQSL